MNGSNNIIHHTAIVSLNSNIGNGNYIGPYCIIGDGVTIGDNNRLEAFVSIGLPAEKHGYFDKTGYVFIGNGNIFREFVTVNSSAEKTTLIQDDCVLLKGSHVGHDSILMDKVTLSCGVKIGGHSVLCEGVNFGLNSCCHQYSVIGAYAMIGMGAVITRGAQVEPFLKFAGVPAKQIGFNVKMMGGENVLYATQERFKKEFQSLYHAK